MRTINMLETRRGRLFGFGILYISEGIPFGFSTTAMVMFMRLQGLSIGQIGAFVAAVLLPWGLKWAWAPVIDIVKLNRFGGRKAWIFLCTAMVIVTLVTMAIVDFAANYQLLIWAVILNNFFCATQDVAIDSLAVNILKDNERALANGFMFGGQYFGIALGGGGAIFVSSLWGFNAALIFVSGLMLANLIFVLLFIQDPEAGQPEKRRVVSAFAHFVGVLGLFVRNLYTGFMESGSGPKLGLLFAILPVGALALAYAILGTLQVDYGLSQAQISSLAFANSALAGIGCLTGGFLGNRYGVKRMLTLFYTLTSFPTAFLAYQISALGLTGIPIEIFYAVVLVHGFCYGMAFAVHAAIFMGMTNPAVAATQFTAYMAISNVAISIGNLWQGIIAERFDYSLALYIDAGLVVFALALIPFLSDRKEKVVEDNVEPVLVAT